MTPSSFLKKNPLFRLAVPLVVGIVIGWHCGVGTLHIFLLAAVSSVIMLFGMLASAPRWLFGVGASLLMLSMGVFVEERREQEMSLQWSAGKLDYRAQLLEEPVVKGSTVKVLAELSLCDSLARPDCRSNGKVYLYFPRSVEAEQLGIGSEVSLDAAVSSFTNAGNPAEFDVEKFYYIKGVTGYAYVGRDEWNHEGQGELTLQMHAFRLRSAIAGMYKSLSFESEELALLSALTLGEKSDFPRELREEYSAAGASHILALSGMHLGVFYMLLLAVLPLWGRKRVTVILRESAVIMLLWAFAFMTGLSPSVVRAALLFTLISLGRCLLQDASGLNSLSLAAIVMLVLSPHLLFDISFQLSFAAVLSILFFAPPLLRLLKVEEHGRLYRYLVNLLIISFVAQAGTLPFVWYYFGVFPLFFLLTNIVVVPLAFVLMSLAVIMWGLFPLPFLQELLALLLQHVVRLMNGAVALIAAAPGSSLSLPPLGVGGACFVAFLLFMSGCTLITRKKWMAYLSLCCTLCFAVFIVLQPRETIADNCIIIYNNNKNPLLHAIAGKECSYLVSTVPMLDAQYEYSSSPLIKREKLSDPQWVNGNYCDSLLSLDDGLLRFGGLTVRMVDNGVWRENIYVMPADVVVLCRGFLGPIEELAEAYPAGCLVLDASLYKRSRERILRECAALGIEPVDISVTGAVMLTASDESFRVEPLRGK